MKKWHGNAGQRDTSDWGPPHACSIGGFYGGEVKNSKRHAGRRPFDPQ